MSFRVVRRTSLTLTADPPSDVDIEECEDGYDDTIDGSDEVFECQDPSRRRRYRLWSKGC